MHASIIPSRRIAAAEPLTADWEQDVPLKVNLMSNVSFIIQGRNVTTSTAQFYIEVRNGEGSTNNPWSDWQRLTLETPLLLANADFDEVVILHELVFDEVRIVLVGDAGGDGDFSIWCKGRGFH